MRDGGARGPSDSGRLPDARRAPADATSLVQADAATHPPRDASRKDPAEPSPDSGRRDGARTDAGQRDAGQADAGERDAGPAFLRIPGWSIKKRVRSEDGTDVVLEEVLSSFADPLPGPTRLRTLSSAEARSWAAPPGSTLSDFCRHPSGAISAIWIAPDRSVSLERLSPDLVPLGALAMHDPLVAGDPHVTDAGALDLLANGFTPDAARIASVGEAVVVVVDTSWNSVVAYRTSFSNGAWVEPQRTLIEPPVGLTPFLPIGGSFDTFGAMAAWYRALLDVDETGNAYVATWASPRRIRVHADEFGDGLAPLPGDPSTPGARDSDVLVTKMDGTGTRVWSRVVGTMHEDEPYAIRAHAGAVAVVGRARRFPGFDNTTWDAFVSVTSSTGELAGSRALPLDASGILLAVDSLPSGGWVVAGSDGWSENPDGLSVLSFGAKLLAVLPAIDGAVSRVPLFEGPRHNELRTVVAGPAHLWFGGHEDGPVMHTGDSDPSLIVATGILGSVHPLPGP